MTTPAQVQQFIAQWEAVEVNEIASAQSHFNALCRLLGVKPPLEADPKGAFFRFEKPLTKQAGTAGRADVWYKDRFAWEYKTKGKYKNLRDAYLQLLLYKEVLDNPPILVACDITNYEVHIAFNGYPTRIEKFTNRDLENQSTRDLLYKVLTNPELLRPVERATTITEKIAGRFGDVARFLEGRGYTPVQIAPFFMKLLFALFAEDIQLLPAELMSRSIKLAIMNPEEFPARAKALFRAMREGGLFGFDRVPRFNGWLFNDDEVIPLNATELQYLADAARYDWAAVEPAVFGTLFERSLDPSKRAQLGAHYTSRDDILLIVEPVLMAPYRREWEALQADILALQPVWEAAEGNARKILKGQAEGKLYAFMERLAKIQVLDPACGSGNFLYVALIQLKGLELDVWAFAGAVGLEQPELAVSPAQLHGIEKNPFAAELAQVVVWIGYLQWMKVNELLEGQPKEPILQSLHTIECRDAILAFDADKKPVEPEWPKVDVIIGNPPFLGGNRIRRELGDTYVEALWRLYEGRVLPFADLVCYWFERARARLEEQEVERVGFLSTNSIRGGANRKVLERIKNSGDIFYAWSDRDWFLDGAAVNVSMIGFDSGNETARQLDGIKVQAINADLTSAVDLSAVTRLAENRAISFQGASAKSPLDIDATTAQKMLAAPLNSNGRPNSDVVRPVVGALELVRGRSTNWTVDFALMRQEEAAQYALPFEYAKQHVYPIRVKNRRAAYAAKWWQYAEPRPGMRRALAKGERYIATPAHSKFRIFVWIGRAVLCNQATIVFAREDDYFFGVLHSRPHELWALRLGTSLEDRPRYTPSTTFETYPFPWPPGTEPSEDADPRVKAIADAARELVRLRDEWLNPPAEALSGIKLKDRTLTNLYNKRPDWLSEAHRQLDAAVFAAYGWEANLSDDEILARLLALNLERAKGQGEVVEAEEEASEEGEGE